MMLNKSKNNKNTTDFMDRSVQSRKGYLVVVLISLLLAAGLLLQVSRIIGVLSFDMSSQAVRKQNKDKIAESLDDTSKLLFLGDIMLDRGVLGKMNNNNAGYDFPFEFVHTKFSEYDLVSANLEGPISDRGTLVGSKYSFRFDPKAAPALAAAGIDVVSLANNHMWDYGKHALCDTVQNLTQAGVGTVGAGCTFSEANDPWYGTVGNTNIMMLGYTNLYPSGLVAPAGENPGVSDLDFDLIGQYVDSFKAQNDSGLAIVQMHWGNEYEGRSHVSQQKIAHALVDLGVDIVIGHHPHVTQDVEVYKNSYIFYSLGNFIFDQYFSEETMRGFAVELAVDSGIVTSFSVLPYVLNSEYQPIFLDREKQAKKD